MSHSGSQLQDIVLSWDYWQIERDNLAGQGVLKGELPKVPLQFSNFEVRHAKGCNPYCRTSLQGTDAEGLDVAGVRPSVRAPAAGGVCCAAATRAGGGHPV